MREVVQKLVEDHERVASQYESVGDSHGAAQCRAVSNMVACLLRGVDAGTIIPALTAENVAAIKDKAQAFLLAENEFNVDGEKYDDWEDQVAYEEGARRAIGLILDMPKEAKQKPWFHGMIDAIRFMEKR
jgi:hypothetical protein